MGNLFKGLVVMVIGGIMADAIANNTFLKEDNEKEIKQNERIQEELIKHLTKEAR